MKKSDIERLERQGCFSDNWDLVTLAEGTDLRQIRNVWFRGKVSVGANTRIINVPGGISDIRIGDNVSIVNVDRIERTAGATFGIGIDVAVLDETGSRTVRIYPGLSAQVAALAARMPDYAYTTLLPLIDAHIAEIPDMPEIGDGAEILDCGPIIDVRIWPGVKVEGAALLRNGSIVSNSGQGDCLAYVGHGVNAADFIIEDAHVADGVLLRHCYVGQGCVIEKNFTAHDSLFFANCTMENGEACAVLAGPYTVSMHKSSLLIGCQTSFMNAGSGTNMSNHMYKLGPVHWGVLERGVKTSSNSYMMHGSRVGAFSLVMGEHKTHPDTSEFPFSYLFGDAKGKTTLVPGAMLKSFGLRRDGDKWPVRDRRQGKVLKINDRIHFDILNPHTVSLIINAVATAERLLTLTPDSDGNVDYNGMRIGTRSLSKGKELYLLAADRYLHAKTKDRDYTNGDALRPENTVNDRWIDLAGMLITEEGLRRVTEKKSLPEIEDALDKEYDGFSAMESDWIVKTFGDRIADRKILADAAGRFDAIVEADRNASVDMVDEENRNLSRL